MTIHAPKSIGIIVPCYNEAHRLRLTEFESAKRSNPSFCFIFVNDASTDRTHEILDLWAADRQDYVSVIHLKKNAGKAEAVRTGVRAVLRSSQAFEWICFIDADLATPLAEIDRAFVIRELDQPEASFISGARLNRLGSNIERKLLRHYWSRVFATIVAEGLRLQVYDTQCGFKLFRRELAELLFERPFISRWYFDVELFARASQLEKKPIFLEVPLRKWADVDGSKITYLSFFKTPFELLKIFFHYRAKLGTRTFHGPK